MGMISEFKTFIAKGNALDLAVGVIIGAAFGKIITSLVNDVLMPPIGVAMGGVNFTNLKFILKNAAVDASGKAIEAVTINYGSFIQSVIDFLIIAFCIFLMVKTINKLKESREKEKVAPEPVDPPADIVLLTEIRDLLKK
ncbi:large-conductance mechanosensitive channel protein MscL [soil metagenome]